MSKWIPLLVGGLILGTAALVWASRAGMGVPRPAKKPVSLREGSAGGAHTGKRYRYRRYFVGGGTFHGK